METLKRTARLVLHYQDADITRDVSKYLLSASYTDNTGKADELTLRLEDSERLWQDAWFPGKGDKVTARIVAEYGATRSHLDCGKFEIDDISLSGPPDVVELKAISSLVMRAIKKEKKSRGWDACTLRSLVTRIAEEHGFLTYYQAAEPIRYTRIDQREESDLALMQRLCDDNDLELKVADNTIIVFEGKGLEKAPVAFSFTRSGSGSRFSFRTRSAEIYRGVEISYQDTEQKSLQTYTFTPPDSPKVGEILKLNQRAENRAAAERIAKGRLRKKNKQEVQCEFAMLGNTAVMAGLCCQVAGFGRYDGKYMIDTATHTIDHDGGYKTRCSAHKVLTW